MSSDRTRRRFLRVGAAALLAGGAGCLSSGDQTSSGSSATSRLSGVEIANLHDERHSVDVLVERDGEIVHWSTHDLDSPDGTVYDDAKIETSWADEPGEFVVSARLDERSTWRQLDLTEQPDAACYKIKVMIESDGSFGFWKSADAEGCGDGEPTATSGA